LPCRHSGAVASLEAGSDLKSTPQKKRRPTEEPHSIVARETGRPARPQQYWTLDFAQRQAREAPVAPRTDSSRGRERQSGRMDQRRRIDDMVRGLRGLVRRSMFAVGNNTRPIRRLSNPGGRAPPYSFQIGQARTASAVLTCEHVSRRSSFGRIERTSISVWAHIPDVQKTGLLTIFYSGSGNARRKRHH